MPIVAMIVIVAFGLIVESVFDILQQLVGQSIKGFILGRILSWWS